MKDANGAELGAYADSFVGEYVSKLEKVVESYRLEHSFGEGEDTVVVSLRDDIAHSKADCLVEGENQLFHASNLGSPIKGTATREKWSLSGCSTPSNTPGETLLCIDARKATTTQAGGTVVELKPFANWSPGLRPVPGWKLTFGVSGTNCSAPGAAGPECNWNENAMLGQLVELPPGRYRYSWYSQEGLDTTTSLPKGGAAAGAVLVNGVAVQRMGSGYIPGTNGRWNRAFFEFELDAQREVLVGFKRPPLVGSGTRPATATVAAPMLEELELDASTEPRGFSDTTETRQVVRRACEDTDGSVFRREQWKRGCVKLCPDGFSSDCQEKAKTHCYWETSFHVSQRAIEAGEQFVEGGFARGNFNYRLDRVGVNFVGAGTRDCTDSSTPQACYGAAYVPYSLAHLGPYYVRNHLGEDYEAHLFQGAIEHARGVAAERYISNPIGSSDKELLEQYMRTELRGRPLDGTFVLRVWDESGVNFGGIEDVQLAIDYRYWTRFD
jgi:hypothetical protein